MTFGQVSMVTFVRSVFVWNSVVMVALSVARSMLARSVMFACAAA